MAVQENQDRSQGNGQSGGKGLVLVDAEKVKAFSRQRLWTLEQAAGKFNLSFRSLKRMLAGSGVRPGTVIAVAKVMGIPPNELLANGQSDQNLEWAIEKPLVDWRTLKSGLEFRAFQLKHRFLSDTLGRGKCFRFGKLATSQETSFREYFLRHPKIVRSLRTSPFFPANHAVFAENGNTTWWIIDEWIAGNTLADALRIGPLAGQDLFAVMVQVAQALQSLHRAVIIRRCLTPENILIRQGDGRVFLTDLELSKLHDGSTTVKEHVQSSPYAAPEVDTGDALDVAVDLYSWGRIFVHAASGQCPQRGTEKAVVDRLPCPDEIKSLVSRCVAIVHSARPNSVDEILAAFPKQT